MLGVLWVQDKPWLHSDTLSLKNQNQNQKEEKEKGRKELREWGKNGRGEKTITLCEIVAKLCIRAEFIDLPTTHFTNIKSIKEYY